jgi:hypothetical protein
MLLRCTSLGWEEFNRTCTWVSNFGLCRLDSSHAIALVGRDSRASLKEGSLRHCRWRDFRRPMGSGIVPVIVNWLNWKLTYRIWLMLQLIAFQFSYDEFIANDFDWLRRWRVSLLIGLWNQLGLSLQSLTSIGCTDQASLLLQCVAVKLDDFSFWRVITCLRPIGLWNPHEIVSVTVNLNSIDISRDFADAISAPKSVGYPARSCVLWHVGKW